MCYCEDYNHDDLFDEEYDITKSYKKEENNFENEYQKESLYIGS